MKMKAALPDSIDIELVFPSSPASVVKATCYTGAEARALIEQHLALDAVLNVVRMKDGADYGNFIVFVNAAGLAYVRLLEHRGFHLQRANSAASATTSVFLSDDGSVFDVEEMSTVPLQTALEALHYWLSTGGKMPGLVWVDE